MLSIKTFEGKEMVISGNHLKKSFLFKSLLTLPHTSKPIDIPIKTDILVIALKFMEIDTTTLANNYNPLDIKFKTSDYNFFQGCSNNDLINL
jgi:S-phase kinase-associated protein 1